MTTAPALHDPAPRRILVSDLLGGALLTALFVGAFLLTGSWDSQAAIFPRGVSLGGAALAVCLVVRALIGTREVAQDHHQEEASDDLEYIFHTANLRQWVVTLAWFGGFSVSLYCLGLYATAVVYTVLYLRTQDGRSWIFSAIYAFILTGVMYVAFTLALGQQVPAGLFGLS
jgi:Tripartite tricarboxylate transporter TctB family